MGLHYVWAVHEMECPPIRLLCTVENIQHMHLVKYGLKFQSVQCVLLVHIIYEGILKKIVDKR
jgi:hypothetical protein